MNDQNSNKFFRKRLTQNYVNENTLTIQEPNFDNLAQEKSLNKKFWQEKYFLGGNYNEKKFRVRRKFIKKRFVNTLEKSIYYTVMKPKNRVKGNIIAVPGWVGSQYMIDFLGQFASEGYLIHTFDFTGRDYSKNYQKGSILDQHLKDIATIFEKVDSSIPTFVYAHCYGALVILVFLILNPEVKISGVMLSSPLINPDKIRNFSLLKSIIFINLLGQYLGPFIMNSFINPTKLCKNNYILQKICQKNPKFFFLSISEGLAIIQALKIVKQNYKKFCHSLLVIHGEKNQISKVEDVKKYFQKLNSQDKTLKIIKDQIHELYLDEGQKSIFNIMIEWMKERENNYESQISIYQKQNWNFNTKTRNYSKIFLWLIISYFVITFLLKNRNLKSLIEKKLLIPVGFIIRFIKVFSFKANYKYDDSIDLHENYS